MKICCLISVFLFLSCSNYKSDSQVINDYAQRKRNGEMLAILLTEMDETIMKMERRALEYGYNYPVLPTMIEIRESVENVFQESEYLWNKLSTRNLSDGEIENFYHAVENIVKENLFRHKNLLLTFGQKTLGLNEGEIAKRIATFDADVYEYVQSLITLKTSFNEETQEDVFLRLSSWEVDFAMKSYQQIKYLNIYLGCQRMLTDPYYPVVFSEQNTVRKGERFNARISIGNYVTYLKPEHVVFKLNGDTLELDSSGLTSVSLTANEVGRRKLDMNCQIKNPFTGEVKEYSSTYNYEVLPKQ